jgi:hypothetical protein
MTWCLNLPRNGWLKEITFNNSLPEPTNLPNQGLLTEFQNPSKSGLKIEGKTP